MRNITVQRFDLLVCYDVETTTKEGRRRLRQVAKTCERHGQRVQFSVFECRLTKELWLKMKRRLLDIMDQELDSLRVYYLGSPREEHLEVYGRNGYVDFSGTLAV